MSKKAEVEVTEEQKKLMRTQDIKYVEMKRVAEANVSMFNGVKLALVISLLNYYIMKAKFVHKF